MAGALDLGQSDEAIQAETERIARNDPSFMPTAEWLARLRCTVLTRAAYTSR